MARVSDIIEKFIKELIKESESNIIEIQRNELAKYFDCAPSQINYVLMTRFAFKQGYYIESIRGGGGHIKIKELALDQHQGIYHIITKEIGNSVTKSQAVRIIEALMDRNIISLRESKIMKAAIDDSAINSPLDIKDQIRANILKNMLAILLE
jgi:transcriptional regulator of stress and heat shock response